MTKKPSWIDVSAPGKKAEQGHIHPISQVTKKITDIFSGMGFEIAEGPEMESEWYNFDALNIPADHPARDLWDTFWIKNKKNYVLRTHTSNVQIRYMEKNNPPIRIIAPGRVFRYEATDATHEAQFHQLEGLMIDKDITLANLKAIFEMFFREFFDDKSIQIRLRPSYFPFVEPGVEIDMKRRGGKWLEIGGAGMVSPEVLKNVKLDPRKWQGFAFGMGIDRMAMLKYKVDDVRLFYSGDLRFINQF